MSLHRSTTTSNTSLISSLVRLAPPTATSHPRPPSRPLRPRPAPAHGRHRNASTAQHPPSIRPNTSAASDNSAASQQQHQQQHHHHHHQQQQRQQQQQHEQQPQEQEQEQQQAHQPQQTLAGSSHEDLLKQRFYHAQSQNKKAVNVVMTGAINALGGSRGDTTLLPPETETTSSASSSNASSTSSPSADTSWTAAGRRSQPSGSPSASSQSAASSASTADSTAESDGSSSASGGDEGAAVHVQHDPRLELHAPAQALRSLEVPFDTHAFVKRLEEGGWTSSVLQAGVEAGSKYKAAAERTTTGGQSSEQELAQGQGQTEAHEDGPRPEQMALQISRRHDPAEAIMEHARFLITRRGGQTAQACLNKGDVENQAYLFSAALSELQTEVQVRARNDAAALHSITTLLQREVDALEQKMKEDVERLKHDIQVDMNNRKAESKEEQNKVEQEIQDLHNRFTISLSDLKTEIEQNVKWDATRRSLFLVFGIAAIVAANLAIADYMMRDDDAIASKAAAAAAAGREVPAHLAGEPPASLGWAAEGRVLSAWPVLSLGASLRFRAAPAMVRAAAASIWSAAPSRGVAAVGLHRTLGSLASAPGATEALERRRSHLRLPQRQRRRPQTAAWMPAAISAVGLSRTLHSGSRSQQASVARSSSSRPTSEPLIVPETDISIDLHPASVSIRSDRLGLAPFRFDHVWLRDACQAQGSVHASNKQKLFHTSDVPLDVALLDAEHPPVLVTRDVPGDKEHVLRVTFAKEHAVHNAFTALFQQPTPAKEAHVSDFSISFLLHHALPDLYAHTHMDVMAVPQAWAGKDPLALGAMARPARIPYDAIRPAPTGGSRGAGVEAEAAASMMDEARDEALYALTEATIRDGFAFVTGVPTIKTATEAGPEAATLRQLASMMGEIRHTFYGELWDVQSKPSSDNIAYTNLDLGLHMDLLYFQNPPRFQFLHMLRNRVKGGASIFVDSFKVAERMWAEDRKLWEVLARVPVGFHYIHAGRHYRFTHPTFELAHDTEGHAGPPLHGSTMPRLSAVNYSPPFQSPLPLHPTRHLATHEDRERFYVALKRFADLTLDPEFRYQKQLQEGECVVFDNRRVLHSRTGFEWDAGQVGEVTRWLKGCYVDGDAIWSTYRALRTKLGGGGGGGGGQVCGLPTSGRTATNPGGGGGGGGRRMFSTTARRSATADVGVRLPASTSTSVSMLSPPSQQRQVSMTGYRPVPPLTRTTLTKVYKQLSKSRLTFLVVLTGMAGYALCPAALTVATTSSPVVTLLALTAGMALCSAAANSLNQLVEAPYDAQMARTRSRPLPSRAVTSLHAFSFASASAVGGVGLLGMMVNPLTALLGAANIVLYSFTYTPMKRMSIVNTWVGAVVGALPPLMGWAACTGTLHHATDLGAWSLAALLFAWQFPHFNSLAHTLRAEYARGGYRMMAVTDPSLNRRVSLRYAVALLPICSIMVPMSGIVHQLSYALLSLPPNVAMIHAAWRFWKEGTQKTAKSCFWISLIHLPAVMLLAMACKEEVWMGIMQWFSAIFGDESNRTDQLQDRRVE